MSRVKLCRLVSKRAGGKTSTVLYQTARDASRATLVDTTARRVDRLCLASLMIAAALSACAAPPVPRTSAAALAELHLRDPIEADIRCLKRLIEVRGEVLARREHALILGGGDARVTWSGRAQHAGRASWKARRSMGATRSVHAQRPGVPFPPKIIAAPDARALSAGWPAIEVGQQVVVRCECRGMQPGRLEITLANCHAIER